MCRRNLTLSFSNSRVGLHTSFVTQALGACPRTCLSGWNCPIRLQLEERGGAGGCTLAVFGSFHYSVLARILFPPLASMSLTHRSLRWPRCSQCPCEVQTARDARNSEMVSVLADAGHIQPEPASWKASVTGVRIPIPLLSPGSVWSGRRVPSRPIGPRGVLSDPPLDLGRWLLVVRYRGHG